MRSGLYQLTNRVVWDRTDPDRCRQEAEDRAGPSPLGYLYRLQKDRSNQQICLSALKIEKVTPCGWRVRVNHRETTVILKKGRKFAYPTLDEAVKDFLRRWEWWRRQLSRKVEEADETIMMFKHPEQHRELSFLHK